MATRTSSPNRPDEAATPRAPSTGAVPCSLDRAIASAPLNPSRGAPPAAPPLPPHKLVGHRVADPAEGHRGGIAHRAGLPERRGEGHVGHRVQVAALLLQEFGRGPAGLPVRALVHLPAE